MRARNAAPDRSSPRDNVIREPAITGPAEQRADNELTPLRFPRQQDLRVSGCSADDDLRDPRGPFRIGQDNCMPRTRSSFIVIACVVAGQTTSHALCRIPPNPALFCGLGTSAIRGDVVAPEEADPVLPAGVLRVAITAVVGDPIEGIVIGAQVDLASDESEFADVLSPPPAGDAVFILQDGSTFVIGAAVGEDGRIQIDNFGSESLPVDYVLTLAVDRDTDRCADVAFAVVEPPVVRGGSGPQGGSDPEPSSSACRPTGKRPLFRQ